MRLSNSIVATAALATKLVVAQTGIAGAALACMDIDKQISSQASLMYPSRKSDMATTPNRSGLLKSAMTDLLQVDLTFLEAIHHWFYVSSTQVPTCVVQVANQDDVSLVVRLNDQHLLRWTFEVSRS